MSFSVVGRHTLSDIRPRFDMPLQEAAADLGIRCVRLPERQRPRPSAASSGSRSCVAADCVLTSRRGCWIVRSVNSLKRICRKFGIPKWPYRQVSAFDSAVLGTAPGRGSSARVRARGQRFSLLKHKRKLEDAMESSPEEDLPTLQLHFEHVSNLLRELDERGFTDSAHLSSFSDHNLGSPLSSEVPDEDSSSLFAKVADDTGRRAFGKRRFSSSSSLSSETQHADALVSPSKRLAKAATTVRSEQRKLAKMVDVTSEAKGKAECGSLELLAQIAAQQTTPPPEDAETKGSSPADRTVAPTAAVGHAYPEPLPPGAPISAASEAMLANRVYSAQQNLHQLARRVHALESSLYYFMAMMQHQQQQQQFQQVPPFHQQHNQPPQQRRGEQAPPTNPSSTTETTT